MSNNLWQIHTLQVDLQFYSYCYPKVHYVCIRSDSYLNKKWKYSFLLNTLYWNKKNCLLQYRQHHTIWSQLKAQHLDHSITLPSSSSQQLKTTKITRKPFKLHLLLHWKHYYWFMGASFPLPPKNKRRLRNDQAIQHRSYLIWKEKEFWFWIKHPLYSWKVCWQFHYRYKPSFLILR